MKNVYIAFLFCQKKTMIFISLLASMRLQHNDLKANASQFRGLINAAHEMCYFVEPGSKSISLRNDD